MAVFFLGIFALAAGDAGDPDFWWHLQTGKYIVENRVIPHEDPHFAFTTEGKPWITHEWLSEVLVWELFRLGGIPLLGIVFAGLIVAAYALVYARSPGKPYVAGFVVLLGALAGLPTWGIRLQVITLFLCSLTLFLLERYFEKPSLSKLVPLPLLMVLWVNLHGGFLLGVALLAGYLIGKSLELRTGQGADELPAAAYSWRDLQRLGVVFVLCLVLIGINPNGFYIYAYPLQTLASPAMQEYIVEWFSPDFHEAIWLPLAALLLGILSLGLFARKRQGLTVIGLTAVSAYAALRSMRNVPLFSVVAAPVMASQVAGLIKLQPSVQEPPRRVRVLLAASLLAVAVLAAVVVGTRLDNQAATDRMSFPVGAANWIAQHRPQGEMFNTYHWGGYLIWRLYPQYQVFIDGRADLHGDEMIVEYRKIYNASRDWEQALQDYGIRLVLIEPDSPLALQLEASSEWEKVYTDKLSALFVKRQ